MSTRKKTTKSAGTTDKMTIGVVGLGLMGCSITTCLLMAGHQIIAVAPLPIDLEHAESRIRAHLLKSHEEGLIKNGPGHYMKNLKLTEDYRFL